MSFKAHNDDEYSTMVVEAKMLARLQEAAEIVAFLDATVISPGEEPEWLAVEEELGQVSVLDQSAIEQVAKSIKTKIRSSKSKVSRSVGQIVRAQDNESVAVASRSNKRTAAKYKIDRRMGENIFGKPKSPINRRKYGPDLLGQRRKRKLSDFGIQLRAKQKLKGYYGDLTEKQFRQIYADAQKLEGDTGESLIQLLERRLDAVVFRAKFATTVLAARQLVNQGHVMVNGKLVNLPSFRVSVGDTVQIRGESKQLSEILSATKMPERDVPSYVNVDFSNMVATFITEPNISIVPYPVQMDPDLVVRFYSED